MTDSLDGHRSTLRSLDSAYKKAKKIVDSDDYKFKSSRVLMLVEQYQPGDPAEKAVFLIGQMSLLAAELKGPLGVIEKYEQTKKTIDEVTERREAEQKALEDEKK